jgi:hypothetical protein
MGETMVIPPAHPDEWKRQYKNEPDGEWFERVLDTQNARIRALASAMVPLMNLGTNNGPLQKFTVTVGSNTVADVCFRGGQVSVKEYDSLLAHIAFYKTLLPGGDDENSDDVAVGPLLTVDDLSKYLTDAVNRIIDDVPMPPLPNIDAALA